MKHLIWIFCAALVGAVSAGCNVKQKMEQKAQEELDKAVEEAGKAAEEAVEEAPEATEEAVEEAEEAEEATEMAVAKEDIDKAAEIYMILHDEELSEDDAKAKVAEKLEEYEWDLEGYEKVTYEISLDPASRAYYQEQIES